MAEKITIRVDPTNPVRQVEGAIKFLCVLAYPYVGDVSKRRRLFDACSSYLVRCARHQSQLQKSSSAAHSTLLRRFPVQQMWGTLNQAHRRLNLRLIAAEMFLFHGTMNWTTRKKTRRRNPIDVNRDRFWTRNPMLPMPETFRGGRRESASGQYEWYVEEFTHVEQSNPPSLNDMVKSLSKRLQLHERNVWKDIVRPIRPVLHMAAALRSVRLGQMSERLAEDPDLSSMQPMDLTTLILRPEWIGSAVDIAITTAKYWDAEGGWAVIKAIDPTEFVQLHKE